MKKQKPKDEFEIYDDKKDAFLEGYTEGLEDTIDTLVWAGGISEDFLFQAVREMVIKLKRGRKWKTLT